MIYASPNSSYSNLYAAIIFLKIHWEEFALSKDVYFVIIIVYYKMCIVQLAHSVEFWKQNKLMMAIDRSSETSVVLIGSLDRFSRFTFYEKNNFSRLITPLLSPTPWNIPHTEIYFNLENRYWIKYLLPRQWSACFVFTCDE